MGTTTKSGKSSKKTAPKKKLDLDTLDASAVELGCILGVTSPSITQAVQSGTLAKNADGRFNIRDAVSSYCKRLRELKKTAQKSKSDIEQETLEWKLDLIKQKSRDWRMQRDRECALEILHSLATAVGELKEEAKMNPALCDAFDRLLSKIEAVNVDSISLAVEGEEEEEDEI